MGAMPMQCAWCGCPYDEWGLLSRPAPTLLAGASHGLCIVCLSALLAAQGARYHQAGDPARARRFERARVSLLRSFLRRRALAATPAQARRLRRSRLLLALAGQLPLAPDEGGIAAGPRSPTGRYRVEEREGEAQTAADQGLELLKRRGLG